MAEIMDLVKRMKDITRASLNEMLEKAEDPVQHIDRYVQQQKQAIHELECLYRDQLKHAHELRQRMLKAKELADKREQQAQLAMQAEEEHVARMALEDKLVHDEQWERYKPLYNQAKEMLIELEDRLEELKADLREVMDKRQYYSARMESLHLRRKINESRAGRNGRSGNWFHRLEDALTDLELEANAFEEIVFGNRRRSSVVGSKDSVIDREIERLKQKMETDRRETS